MLPSFYHGHTEESDELSEETLRDEDSKKQGIQFLRPVQKKMTSLEEEFQFSGTLPDFKMTSDKLNFSETNANAGDLVKGADLILDTESDLDLQMKA